MGACPTDMVLVGLGTEIPQMGVQVDKKVGHPIRAD